MVEEQTGPFPHEYNKSNNSNNNNNSNSNKGRRQRWTQPKERLPELIDFHRGPAGFFFSFPSIFHQHNKTPVRYTATASRGGVRLISNASRITVGRWVGNEISQRWTSRPIASKKIGRSGAYPYCDQWEAMKEFVRCLKCSARFAARSVLLDCPATAAKNLIERVIFPLVRIMSREKIPAAMDFWSHVCS